MSDISFASILPDGWQRARGFSYAVRGRGGSLVAVAGQVARRNGAGDVEPNMGFAEQWAQALGNVVALVRAAGGGAENIIALRIYVTDMEAYRSAGAALSAAWHTHMGKHFPASTLVQVQALVDRQALVEIEAEALLP